MLAQFNGNVIESLEGVKVPTLVLVGANDQPLPRRERLHGEQDPGSTKVVPCRRGPRVEHPPAGGVQRAVIAFLKAAWRGVRGCEIARPFAFRAQ
jgi:pimeloyl-ACP methyl ester carboxylesterase